LKKLAIVTTHPIQYYAPWFKLLAADYSIELKVFYTWSQAQDSVKDRNFGMDIKWDIPLLDGYAYEFVENKAKRPGSHHFFGINCPELIPKITSYQPDIILVFGWNFISHLKVMRFFKGKVPVWFRGDSTLLDEQPGFKTQLRRTVLSFVYRSIDKALYVGKANKAYYLKHGLKDNQLVYVPHAVDNDRFKNDTLNYDHSANIWRKELGYHDEDIVIVFAGKFEPKKQPDLLLEAVQDVNKQREQPLRVVFIGHGVLEGKLKESALHDENVQILPFQNQSLMPIVYRLGDVLCLPSKGPGETWGLALNEAMASKRVGIVSDKVGSSQDLIRNGINGFVFTHNKPSELEDILKRLNKSDLDLMSTNASESINNWSYEILVNNILKALNETDKLKTN
jgi:glycosyltransferase involved in cell wall biosynthesis